MREAKRNLESRMAKGARPDPWKDAVYSFTESFCDWNRQTLTLAAARVGVREACAIYGLKPPPVKLRKSGIWSYCMSDGSGIFFVRQDLNVGVVLHEAAHYITDAFFGDSLEDHSTAFQAILFYLLKKTKVAPDIALAAAARSYGMTWRTLPPHVIWRWVSSTG